MFSPKTHSSRRHAQDTCFEAKRTLELGVCSSRFLWFRNLLPLCWCDRRSSRQTFRVSRRRFGSNHWYQNFISITSMPFTTPHSCIGSVSIVTTCLIPLPTLVWWWTFESIFWGFRSLFVLLCFLAPDIVFSVLWICFFLHIYTLWKLTSYLYCWQFQDLEIW